MGISIADGRRGAFPLAAWGGVIALAALLAGSLMVVTARRRT